MFGGLFGPSTPGEAAMKQAKSAAPPPAGGGGGGGGGGRKEEPYKGSGFDPRGLERAAAAAKVLNSSPHAKAALELIQEQERTKQVEFAMQTEAYNAHKQQIQLQQLKEKYEEDRRYLSHQTEQAKQQAEYSDKLERERYIEKLRAEQYLHEQELNKQLAMYKQQEEMRRQTIRMEAELAREREMKRVDEETKGRIKQEQQNHDLRLEQTRVAAAEQRQTTLEAIRLAGETMGQGMRDFLSDPEKMTAAAGTVTAIALGVYSAKVGTSVAGRYIESRLGKPTLIRETSRQNVLQTVKHPVTAMKKVFTRGNADGALSGVVLEEGLEQRLQRIAASTFNTKRNNAPFRHLLLYGPPGTGKTLFAKGLARHSGLEYAILTGGDVAPLGRDAVTEIHKVFDWANASNKGLLLFIDEADAFLRKRSTEALSEDLRNALNAFLYRTGEPTKKFMLVYASNQPEQFDWAINDRIDEMVEFALPGLEERERMLEMYINKYLRQPEGSQGGLMGSTATKIIVKDIDDSHVKSIAERTEGFSGREIAKLAIAWQAAAYGSADATFDVQLMESVLESHMTQKARKRMWNVHHGVFEK